MNWSRGQFTEALMIAKKKKLVEWGDIADNMQHIENVNLGKSGLKLQNNRLNDKKQGSLKEYMMYLWNNPSKSQSPYGVFNGALKPSGQYDKDGNIIYAYNGEKWEW